MDNHKIFKMPFASVYPHYINKIIKKGRTTAEAHEVIKWLTGYTDNEIQQIINQKIDFENFFAQAPKMHPNAHKITGMICGHRIEEITNPLMQKIRYMDKLIDELAQGKSMDKILRK